MRLRILQDRVVVHLKQSILVQRHKVLVVRVCREGACQIHQVVEACLVPQQYLIPSFIGGSN